MRKIIYADTTEVHFTEEESIDYGIFKAWEKSGFDNPVYLRYKNNQLEECTWQQALHTPEYRNHRILLFGEISDVNNENGDMIYEEVCPELTIIDKK